MRCKKEGRVYYIIWFNKYYVIRKLGQGGSGEVFLVYHKKLNCYQAIKRISKLAADQQTKEVDIIKVLRHPNIPFIFDLEEDENYIYLVEEYVQGESLRAYRLSHSYIQENDIIWILIQLCEVLHFLHSLEQPILYLDIKPDNIIINENKIKLIDFGASCMFQEGKQQKVSFGTKGYAAPEQYASSFVDERTDIYGIGGILFFLYLGRNYQGDSHYKRREELRELEKALLCSSNMFKVIKKCLQPLPIQRYQSICEIEWELTNKKEKKAPHINKHIIGIIGASNGVGVTHLCTIMAEYLSICKGQRVALAEFNTHSDFLRIEEARIGKGKQEFDFRGVRYFAQVDNMKLLEILKEEFTYVIIDLGDQFSGKKEVLNLCHQKILVGAGAYWKSDIMHQKMKLLFEKDWMYLYNLSNKGFPYAVLGRHPDKKTRIILEKILQEGNRKW